MDASGNVTTSIVAHFQVYVLPAGYCWNNPSRPRVLSSLDGSCRPFLPSSPISLTLGEAETAAGDGGIVGLPPPGMAVVRVRQDPYRTDVVYPRATDISYLRGKPDVEAFGKRQPVCVMATHSSGYQHSAYYVFVLFAVFIKLC